MKSPETSTDILFVPNNDGGYDVSLNYQDSSPVTTTTPKSHPDKGANKSHRNKNRPGRKQGHRS